MNILWKIVLAVVLVFIVLNIVLVGRFYLGKKNIAVHNQEIEKYHIDLPVVDHLTVQPVVDLLAKNDNYKTETGLSYLIETDNDSVLFDVGYNKKQEEVSPLLHNLKELDINLDDINTFAISHNHADHVGGLCYTKKRVELTKGLVDLKGKSIYTPVPLTCDTAVAKTVDAPMLITKNIASTGPLAEQMFIPGELYEQSLLLNLKGKGLVIISGCGHPGIIRIVETAQKITGIPVYAVVGGLHLYYSQPESGIWGNIFGSSKLFCMTPNQNEVVSTVKELKKLGVKKAYISSHDADQATLKIFADEFGADFDTIKIGEPVIF